MINIEHKWEIIKQKKEKKEFVRRNKEVVVVRLVHKGNKYSLRVSIGLNIAGALGFERNKHVDVYKNSKYDRLVKIELTDDGGYKLRGDDNSSFLVVVFAWECPQGMKLSTTMVAKHVKVDATSTDKSYLVVDLSALY